MGRKRGRLCSIHFFKKKVEHMLTLAYFERCDERLYLPYAQSPIMLIWRKVITGFHEPCTHRASGPFTVVFPALIDCRDLASHMIPLKWFLSTAMANANPFLFTFTDNEGFSCILEHKCHRYCKCNQKPLRTSCLSYNSLSLILSLCIIMRLSSGHPCKLLRQRWEPLFQDYSMTRTSIGLCKKQRALDPQIWQLVWVDLNFPHMTYWNWCIKSNQYNGYYFAI